MLNSIIIDDENFLNTDDTLTYQYLHLYEPLGVNHDVSKLCCLSDEISGFRPKSEIIKHESILINSNSVDYFYLFGNRLERVI